MSSEEATFWDHLDELRKVLFRILIVVVLFTIIAFVNKGVLFDIVLAPHNADFVTYRFFCSLAAVLEMPSLCPSYFHVDLISTQLTSQFVIHMTTALYAGIIVASPYILYQLFRFISPALYANEKKYSRRVVSYAFVLFFAGVLLNYFLIFPLSFRFLATYQISPEVINTITIASYMDTFLMLSLLMGITFELPVIAYFFAKFGFLTAGFMKKYRKHAVVVILVIAAIITPTSDIFTLLLVSVPVYCLYEASIWIVKKISAGKNILGNGNDDISEVSDSRFVERK